ncbi:transcription termination factor 1-like [Chanos chanos]|uniref:Transcription termination factor 1-like n=1 Tax=Chanos chanos TaxID=29144 RepID=A0A6J2WTP5_CHACN|nr:transcription termination factor 1-like [Chanos chanos]
MLEEYSEVTGEEMPSMSQHEIPAEASQKKTNSNKQGEGEINGWTVEVPIQGAPADETPRKRKKKKRKEMEMDESIMESSTLDVAIEETARKKKKKQKEKERDKSCVEFLTEHAPIEETQKKKKKKRRETETNESIMESSTQDAAIEETPRKKKKKKRKERETEEFAVEPTTEEVPIEGVQRKKKKEQKEMETDESIVESSTQDTPRKKKKKQKDTHTDSSSMEFLTQHSPKEETQREKQKETETDESTVGFFTQDALIEETPRKRNGMNDSTKEPTIQETKSEETATEKDANSSAVEATVQEGQRVKTSPLKNEEREVRVSYNIVPKTLDTSGKKANGERTETRTTCTSREDTTGKKANREQQQRKQKRDEKELNMMKQLDELKEFVPNAELKFSQKIGTVLTYDLPRFKEFKRKGIPLRSGRFSKQENKRLIENVKDFMALTGIDNAVKLFYPSRFPEEESSLRKAKRDNRFLERISEGIPRSCHDIYKRGRNLFDDRGYMGEFTEEEVRSLCKLHSLHGNDWKKISDLTGRSPAALAKRFSQLISRTGRWSEGEDQTLLHAVRDHIISKLDPEAQKNPGTARVSRTDLYSNLPWSHLAEKVKTRTWIQCRRRWMSIVKSKMSPDAVKDLKQIRKWKIQLIKAMYQMNPQDRADVNWEDLAHTMGNLPPAYLQERFQKLKSCYVPNWQTKSFGEIIDFLHDRVLPVLEGEVTLDCTISGSESNSDSTQQDTFLFSDIFGHEDGVDREKDDDDEDEDDDDDDKEEI